MTEPRVTDAEFLDYEASYPNGLRRTAKNLLERGLTPADAISAMANMYLPQYAEAAVRLCLPPAQWAALEPREMTDSPAKCSPRRKNNIELVIDPEFESLLLPLSENERNLLREQILRDGCREPLSVWRTEDDKRILIDGHNRYNICKENQLGFQTINVKLSSREEAKLWILEHQVGRRNLTDDQRAAMWNEIREQRSVVARAKQLRDARAIKEGAVSVKTTDTVKTDTRAAVAKESKIPESKLRAVQGLKKSNPDLYKRVQSGDLKIRDAKKSLQKRPPSNYSGTEFFHSIGTKMVGALLDPRLKELLNIKESQWTPQVEKGLQRLITNLKEVSEKADGYARDFEKLLKQYGRRAA